MDASPANRIHQGESCAVVFWSNSASHSMTGTFRVVYDDGTEDEFGVNRLGSAGTRVAQIAYTKRTALKDGYVVSLAVGMANATIVRGQCYAMAGLIRHDADAVADIASAAALVSVLAQGYVWFAHPLRLGTYIEAGPAGGHGMVQTYNGGDPAAGSELAAFSAPTGTIVRVISVSVQLVQGITQTPLPSLVFRDASGNKKAQIPITTTPIAASSTSQLTWGKGLVQTSFTTVLGDEMHTAPLPSDLFLSGLADLVTSTDGIGANTNYGTFIIAAEEWVVPN